LSAIHNCLEPALFACFSGMFFIYGWLCPKPRQNELELANPELPADDPTVAVKSLPGCSAKQVPTKDGPPPSQ
jgi:hypothetical protein